MREYKFRAWDSLAEKMYSWTELLNKNLKNIFTIPEQCGYDLMQYTGLKDKNGKEIYEGDIVYILPEDERGIIRWDNETARYVVIYDNIISDFDNWYGKDLEVIGNVYDNKNLLEEGE